MLQTNLLICEASSMHPTVDVESTDVAGAPAENSIRGRLCVLLDALTANALSLARSVTIAF